MIVNEIIFKIIFVVVWTIYILIRAPFDKAYRSQRKIKILDAKIERHLLLSVNDGAGVDTTHLGIHTIS